MTLMYGHRWPQTLTSEEEEVRKLLWINVLKDLSDEQIKFGLEYCEKDRPLDEKGQAWPPNPREFLEYCRMFQVTKKENVQQKEIDELKDKMAQDKSIANDEMFSLEIRRKHYKSYFECKERLEAPGVTL